MKSKEQKRSEAAARQAEYNSLSYEQKVARAKSRPGNSKKELSRLELFHMLEVIA